MGRAHKRDICAVTLEGIAAAWTAALAAGDLEHITGTMGEMTGAWASGSRWSSSPER